MILLIVFSICALAAVWRYRAPLWRCRELLGELVKSATVMAFLVALLAAGYVITPSQPSMHSEAVYGR